MERQTGQRNKVNCRPPNKKAEKIDEGQTGSKKQAKKKKNDRRLHENVREVEEHGRNANPRDERPRI